MYLVRMTLLAALSVASFSACINAASISLFDRLQASSDFKVEKNKYLDMPSVSLEYCPTHKCDVFVSSNLNLDKFATFMDMYILYASGFSDFAKYEYGKLAPPIDYIRHRFEKSVPVYEFPKMCKSNSESEAISCTLQSLATELSIVKIWVVYDLGKHVHIRNDDWKDKELGVQNIEMNFRRHKILGLIE